MSSAGTPVTRDVAPVRQVRRHPGGHVSLVEPRAVLVKEPLVDQLLGDHHMSETGNQGGVGPGPQRHPLVSQVHRRIGVARVENDDLVTGELLGRLGHEDLAAPAHPGLMRVVAEHQDKLAVDGVVVAVRALPAAVVKVDCSLNIRRAVIVVLPQRAADAVQHAGHRRRSRRPTGGDGRAEYAGPVVDIDRLVAVGLDQSREGTGDGGERLIPRDLGPLALATLADPFHWLL
jgi:hypothetical protein